jgi:glucose-1-phosphatase
MAVRYIAFDSGNVLVKFDTERFYSFIRENRRNCLDPKELFSGSKKQIIIDFDFGRITDKDFFSEIKRAFMLSSRVSFKDFFYVWGYVMKPDYMMLRIRDEYRKRGVGTILISNMNLPHYDYLKRFYPEVLSGYDYSFISCMEYIGKPSPEAIIRPCDFLGIKSEECIFIDDSLKNIIVACDLGVKTWHYNVTNENFITTPKLDEEREKFRNFLDILWRLGILKPKS